MFHNTHLSPFPPHFSAKLLGVPEFWLGSALISLVRNHTATEDVYSLHLL